MKNDQGVLRNIKKMPVLIFLVKGRKILRMVFISYSQMLQCWKSNQLMNLCH